ncbi:response regulator [Piscinibacter sakaiensis]|uniref:response regulator n=1 Tax=Piscinibacter sakaiensis TaxID=1547922 RepID=UPI003AAE36AE
MAIRKILLVDDSKTELHHLSALLGKHGFSVNTADSGSEALRQLDADRPDLVLMDIVMPGQNGFMLTRSITRDPRYAGLPVIICSSKNQESDRIWGLRQGAVDFVVKPVDADDLVAKIRRCG